MPLSPPAAPGSSLSCCAPDDVRELREYLLLPDTRRAIGDALFDVFDELVDAGRQDWTFG